MERFLGAASDDQLIKWSTDPNCVESGNAAKLLSLRQSVRAAKREALQDNPFDPRTEVSADVKHVVKHLWIIFVLLPFVFGLLWALISAMR